MYNRLEFPFQPVFLFAEDACETGYDAKMGRAFPMGAVPESASQILTPERDTVSQWRCFGNCVPEYRLKTVRSFPMAIEPETTAQNSPSEWDALSG